MSLEALDVRFVQNIKETYFFIEGGHWPFIMFDRRLAASHIDDFVVFSRRRYALIMDMFDCIAVVIAFYRGFGVDTAASLSGYTGGDGKHNRCPGSDEVAHCENTYNWVESRLFCWDAT